MSTRIYEYDDIQVATEPHILYKLPINDQYNIIAYQVPDTDNIKLSITDDHHNFVDTDGNLLPADAPYVSTVVFNTTEDYDNTIKSEMLKLADTINSLSEGINNGEGDNDTMWEELKKSDPFNRGWSTKPLDAVETLQSLGFNITDIERGIVDPYDRIIHFEDRDGNEGEVYVNRVGQNTFRYVIHSDMYDEDHDDLYEPEIDEDTSMDSVPQDEEHINKYLTLKYHFLDQGYNEKDAEKLAIKNMDKDTIEECDLSEASVSDQTVTIGLYGDNTGEYESLDQMIKAMKSAGLSITELEGDEDYGWSFNVTGPAKKIYRMVDEQIPGYNCDGVQEFIDQYSINEKYGDSLRDAPNPYDDEDDDITYDDTDEFDPDPEDFKYLFGNDEDEMQLNEYDEEQRSYANDPYFAEDNEKAKECLRNAPVGSIIVFNEEIPGEEAVFIKLEDGSWALRDAPYAEVYSPERYDQFIYTTEPSSFFDGIIEPTDPRYRDYDSLGYVNEGLEQLDIKKHKVGDKVSVPTEGMTDPSSYSVGDDIKIGALRGTIDKIYPDKFDITITYNGFLDERRVEYEDDIVIVKNKDGRVDYKGLMDYSPFKDAPWKYDPQKDIYTLPDGCTMKCIDESALNEEVSGNKMTIEVRSGMSADGFEVTITDGEGKTIFHERYDYGYNASYNRAWSNERKPYVTDILEDLCTKYEIDKSSIEVVPGYNTFAGKSVRQEYVDDFKKDYLSDL